MKTVFFGCSMRGGYEVVSKSELARLPDIIEEAGFQLASRHQTQDYETIEAEMTTSQIHDRDYRWLKDSDFGVFEISNPSLGVGGEISDMLNLGKPVLCLYKKGLEKQVSAYTQGKHGSKYVETPFECHAYESLADAKKKILNFAGKYT